MISFPGIQQEKEATYWVVVSLRSVMTPMEIWQCLPTIGVYSVSFSFKYESLECLLCRSNEPPWTPRSHFLSPASPTKLPDLTLFLFPAYCLQHLKYHVVFHPCCRVRLFAPYCPRAAILVDLPHYIFGRVRGMAIEEKRQQATTGSILGSHPRACSRVLLGYRCCS